MLGAFEAELGNVRLTAKKYPEGKITIQEKGKLSSSMPFCHGSLVAEAKAGRTAGTKGELTLRAARA